MMSNWSLVIVFMTWAVFVSAMDVKKDKAVVVKTTSLSAFSALKVPSSVKSKTINHIQQEDAKLHLRPDIFELPASFLPTSMQTHKVVFATKQLHLSELHDHLIAVSTPNSEQYGKYWTFDEIQHFTECIECISFIEQLLQVNPSMKALDVSRAKDFFTIEAPIALWEELFQTKFSAFCMHSNIVTENTAKDSCDPSDLMYRARSYSLPDFLTSHVEAAFYVTDFPMKVETSLHTHPIVQELQYDEVNAYLEQNVPDVVRHLRGEESRELKQKVELTAGAVYPNYVYPAVLNKYYNITNNTGSSIVTQAVYATIGQTMSPSDLTAFQTKFALPIQGIAQDVNGHVSNSACVANGNDCIEANLDIQYMMAVAQKIPTVFYYWNTSAGGGVDWLGWVTTIASLPNPSDVYSISYGGNELGMSENFMNSFNNQAMKLGLMGTTILASSGDHGISPLPGSQPVCSGYYPQFPAGSQYVTAVGATMVRNYYSI